MALKGVNLGGWLVVESWITPSLFKGLAASNEYELSQDKVGRERLKQHHKNFIKESDWKWLAVHGIELVRIPVGYWILNGDKPYIEAKEQLDWSFNMAKKYNICILLDLHAAPGAQNDSDHSGSGKPMMGVRWLKSRKDQVATIATLEQLAKEYGHHPKLWGLQLLNEPATGWFGLRLAWFYRRAYRAVTLFVRPGVFIVFSDGYRPWLLTNTFGWLARKGYPPMIDVHLYHCFGPKNSVLSTNGHRQLARRRARMLRILQRNQQVMIGEWSAVLARQPDVALTKEFFDMQEKIYNTTTAQCYWSYKTESNNVWNYRYIAEKSI